MITTTLPRILTAAMLSIARLSRPGPSYADIGVGSYWWAQRGGDASGNGYGGGYCHLDIAWTWTIENGQQRVQGDWTTAAK